ncbi:28S ribosomal protein S5, mitochondrial [Halotydeus destructor]|nr:28S ribosomal protein S5, mitochondrial [Halotydeus destructor]
MHSLERGWAGTTQPGRWIGPPDPILDEKFEGFDTKVLMLQNQFCMKANTGKTRSVKTICVTGAKNGLAGFAVGKAKDGRTALKKAKNLAAQRLRYFELYEGHTLMHDFSSQYGAVRVNAFKKPPGYGIVAQRAIKAICEVIGIKDIYVKAEGAQTHTLHVVRAFFLGLANQKSFQEMADDKKLHLVELKEETDYFPKVLASPSDGVVRTEREIPPDENTDFRMYINNGNIIQIPPRKYPDYTRTAGYLKFLQKWHYHRSRQDVRVYLKAKHGKLDTFLLERERKERAQRKVALALESPKEEAAASS